MVLMESSYYYYYNNSNKNKNNNHNWRRAKEETFHHNYNQQQSGSSRPRSQNNRRPSFGWQLSSWEKKFCTSAGVPWQKVLQTKKYMDMNQDEKVLQWNDTAVEEAFWNAKQRFWAEMVGQPCDITPPDPDIFIDHIDWDSNSNVDPDLLSDLDRREPGPHSDAHKGDGVVIGIPVPEQYLMTSTGWGDVEEDNKGMKDDHFWGCENEFSYVPRDTNNNSNNNKNGPSWNQSYKKQQQWDQGHQAKCGSNEHDNWNVSRYKVSRFDGDGKYGPLVDDCGGKRDNFAAYERPVVKWRPVTRQW